MTVVNRAHAEALTRDAAKAIGLHVPHNARWDLMLGGLQLYPATPYTDNTFAPLNVPGDAYRIEAALKINVTHRALSNQTYVLILRDSESNEGASIMKTVNKDDDYLRLRMEAVVMFASLSMMVGDKHGVQA